MIEGGRMFYTPVKLLWAACKSGRNADVSITKPGDSTCGSEY